MAIPLLPLFGSASNPGPDNWVDALNQIINYLNTNFFYNPISGGGGSTGRTRQITSGINDTISSLDFNGTVAWNSANAAGKLETFIAGPGGTTQTKITIIDEKGTAGAFNINVQPSGCTINNQSGAVTIDGNLGYLTFTWDGVSNWMVSG